MSEFQKLRVVTGYEFLKHIRRKRMYIVLAIALIVELIVLITVPLLLDGYPDNIMVMSFLLVFGPSMATIGAVFFAGDAIAGEFEGKTGFILFTNPVKRITLITGKYLASCVAVILVVIFGYLIICISLLVIYGRIPIEMLHSYGLALLFGGSVVSVTFFFSAISKGAMGATVITLILIIVIFGIAESVLMMAGKPTWFLLSTGGDSVGLVFGRMELLMEGIIPVDAFDEMPFELETPDVGLSTIAMAGYLVVGFILSLWIGGRRQLA